MKYKLQDFRLIKTFFQLTKYWKGISAQKRIKLSHQFWTKPYSKCDFNLIPTRDSFILTSNNTWKYSKNITLGPHINFCTARDENIYKRDMGY